MLYWYDYDQNCDAGSRSAVCITLNLFSTKLIIVEIIEPILDRKINKKLFIPDNELTNLLFLIIKTVGFTS